MAPVNLKSLIGKLNDTCRQALEGAAGLCVTRTNYNVEVEHWLSRLIEQPNTDLDAILRHFEVDHSRLQKDLTRSIDRLQTGNSRHPALSPDLVELAREAWLVSSLEYGCARTRSGHLLCALVSDDALARLAYEISEEFRKIDVAQLHNSLVELTRDTAETAAAAGETPLGAGDQAGPGGSPLGAPGQGGALDQFTIDLTARARSGKIDPVVGRDAEVRQIIDILTRRRQNNPILTGEAGVGKTAVVEGFAQRVVAGDVPPPLRNISVRTLDLGLLQAGAGVRGEFENRLKQVIEEVQKSPQPVILFIDEAHTLIGAGGASGQGDAANLLKPALARGELRTIAATTWAEYKKYFEKDAALARRFQVVKVEEPTDELAVAMMRGVVGTFETHHGIEVLDEAVHESVRLSRRYLSGRQLPDKSVSLLDTACARVALGHSAVPPAIEDCQRSIDQAALSIEILKREQAAGSKHEERLQELETRKAELEEELRVLNERWQAEKNLVQRIREIREQLAGRPNQPAGKGAPAKAGDEAGAGADGAKPAPAAAKPLSDEEKAQLREVLSGLTAELKTLQGDSPLVLPCVDGQAIASVLAGWTGIPVGRMVADEINTVLSMKERMEERVVGQSHAIEAIAQRIRTSRAGLTDPRKPVGVFFLVGPSGVGKTETAITLAELLYGGEQNMTVINMSEFKEEHKVSLLMGSPPGYVGYGEGGVLTEAVRRRPYSVVLLDEMEKAHSGIQDVFYQVFDKGMLRDGEGRDIDFKNTVILMTSNAASDLISKLCADPDTAPDVEGLVEALRPELLKTFKPAFLGRVTVVPYFPLSDDVMQKIIEIQLGRIRHRIRDHYRATFEYAPAVVSHIAVRCKEVESGARNVDRILSGTMLPELSTEFLSRMSTEQPISSVRVDVGEDGRFIYELS